MNKCKKCGDLVDTFAVGDIAGGGWCSSECWRGLPKPPPSTSTVSTPVKVESPKPDTMTLSSTPSSSFSVTFEAAPKEPVKEPESRKKTRRIEVKAPKALPKKRGARRKKK